jgi:Spy/CpxP family protein refolding chaperone
MRYKTTFLLRATVVGLVLTALIAVADAQQAPQSPPVRSRKPVKIRPQSFDVGTGMSSINTDLMQVAAESAMFLQFSEQIGLTAEQQKKLEEAYLEAQKFSVRRQADLDVAEAELRRILSNDQVDLAAVRLKLKEVEALRAEETLRSIEAVLLAISTLSHEQHIKVILLTKQILKQELPSVQYR